jgi:hypothetical protein
VPLGTFRHGSRLWGMFCFPDLSSAQRAASWGHHFRSENLVAVCAEGIGLAQRFDSNWITHAPLTDEGTLDRSKLDWLRRYWSGEPRPDHDPIWETMVDGKLIILGTQVRQRAYEFAADTFPESKCLLEFGRIAAWQGFDLGHVSPFLFDEGDHWSCRHYMNLTDCEDENFLERLAAHFKEGEPVNHEYLKRFFESGGDLGEAPDMRSWSFSRWKAP